MESTMQREDDLQYYYKRAETELERAQSAVDPAAVKAHYLLAGYYLDRVYNRELPAGHGR
ncbi:hypothetical protein CA235_11775 [Sphingomonas sp. ABOLF]|nr:hypothetical protein CA235_11775 [Sphingomonas sp. ABOLF]